MVHKVKKPVNKAEKLSLPQGASLYVMISKDATDTLYHKVEF